jgi:hypothetical protein
MLGGRGDAYAVKIPRRVGFFDLEKRATDFWCEKCDLL